MAGVQRVTRWVVWAAAAASIGFVLSARAQPQLPATFFGSAAIDGAPVADGTPVRALIEGKDCTQPGPAQRGTIRDGEASAYVLTVMHESQEPGCGREGKVVTFTVGGLPAMESAEWRNGAPRRLDLNAASAQQSPVPRSTPVPGTTSPAGQAPTPTAAPSMAPATTRTSGASTVTPSPETTPSPAGGAPSTVPSAGLSTAVTAGGPGPEEAGDGGVWGVIGVSVLLLALAAGVAGYALSRLRE